MKKFGLWASFLGPLSIGIFLFAGTKTATMQVTAIVPESTQIALASPLFNPVSPNGGASAISNISIRSAVSSNYAIRVEGGWLSRTNTPGISSGRKHFYSGSGDDQIFRVFAKNDGNRILTITIEY